ncbi:lytic transglycosylase domain-containing protein [Denitromonas halophila]|uniref:lytic transglycosylase domain-containing protein n=1 Tax=Denitromonas halophila TaxID=1629404 RepID=UPI001FE48649|nr:lytic transglycosylase domain-containing protein [Denitromonas halophila]
MTGLAKHIAASLLGAALCAPLAVHADTLYSFVDEHGVMHFSDSPVTDTRYRRIAGTPQAAPSTGKPQPRPAPAALRPHIEHAARQTGLDPALIQAVAQVESAFNPNAQSPKGALGLMQLMPATAERYGVTNPLDPATNLLGGARYLSDLLRLFNDDLELALAAYNAGESAVTRYDNRIPPYRETRAYVPRVLARYAVVRDGWQANAQKSP